MKPLDTIVLQGRFVGLFANLTKILLDGLPTEGTGDEIELGKRRAWDVMRKSFILQGISLNTEEELTRLGWPKVNGEFFRVNEHERYDIVYGLEKVGESNMSEWIARKPHATGRLLALITKFPDGMSDELKAALRQIFELHNTTITGLKSELSLQCGDRGVIGGKTLLSGNPVLTILEGYGYPVRNALEEYAQKFVIGKDAQHLADNGLSVLFIEPDPTHTVPLNAWHYCGVWFQSITVEGRREPNNSKPLEYNIQLAGMHETNVETVRTQAEIALKGLADVGGLTDGVDLLRALAAIGDKVWVEVGRREK